MLSWAYHGHIMGISGAYLEHILGISFGEAAKLGKEDKEVCDHHTTKEEEEEGGLYLRHMGAPHAGLQTEVKGVESDMEGGQVH